MMRVNDRCNFRSKYLFSLSSLVFIITIIVYAIVYFQVQTDISKKNYSFDWHLLPYYSFASQSPRTTPISFDDEKLSPIEERFKKRLDTVRRFCAGKPRHVRPFAEDNPYNYIELYDYYETNIFVCSPPKAASTTLDNFLINEILKPMCKDSNYSMGRPQTRDRHQIKESTLFESINNLDRIKILISREPLSRILSCWYNKFSGIMGKSQVRVSG